MEDWISNIRRLGELQKEGILSDEEFVKEKNLILAESQTKPQFTNNNQAKKNQVISAPKSNDGSNLTELEKKLSNLFISIWTLLNAVSGPLGEWLNREGTSEYKPYLSTAETFFGYDYPEDSIWGSALVLDLLFGGLLGLVSGLILVKLYKAARRRWKPWFIRA